MISPTVLSAVPIERLKAFVDNAGGFPWHNAERAEPIVRNLCASLDREQELIMVALREGVPIALQRSFERGRDQPSASNLRLVSRHLGKRAFLENADADWVVQTIAAAMGLIPAPVSSPTSPRAPSGFRYRAQQEPEFPLLPKEQAEEIPQASAAIGMPIDSRDQAVVDSPADPSALVDVTPPVTAIAESPTQVSPEPVLNSPTDQQSYAAGDTPFGVLAELGIDSPTDSLDRIDDELQAFAVIPETHEPADPIVESGADPDAQTQEGGHAADSPNPRRRRFTRLRRAPGRGDGFNDPQSGIKAAPAPGNLPSPADRKSAKELAASLIDRAGAAGTPQPIYGQVIASGAERVVASGILPSGSDRVIATGILPSGTGPAVASSDFASGSDHVVATGILPSVPEPAVVPENLLSEAERTVGNGIPPSDQQLPFSPLPAAPATSRQTLPRPEVDRQTAVPGHLAPARRAYAGGIPEEVEEGQWCWSGFLGGYAWMWCHEMRLYVIGFLGSIAAVDVLNLWYLYPVLTLGFHSYMGARGHKLAWSSRTFSNKNEYRNVQKSWILAGIVLLLVETAFVGYRVAGIRGGTMITTQMNRDTIADAQFGDGSTPDSHVRPEGGTGSAANTPSLAPAAASASSPGAATAPPTPAVAPAQTTPAVMAPPGASRSTPPPLSAYTNPSGGG